MSNPSRKSIGRRSAPRTPRTPIRVGVFGGTFDPVHFGHLRSVEEAREQLSLDRVLLVPAADPPHKQRRRLTPAPHRTAMLRRAVRGQSYLRVSSVEIDRPGKSFTIDTLRQLRRAYPHWQLTLLMGADAFADIATWKDYPAIFAEVDVAVFSRPTQCLAEPRDALPVAVRGEFRYSPSRRSLVNQTGKRIHFLTVTALDISATEIRDRVRRDRSIRFLLPPTVERYIAAQRLYRHGRTSS